MNELTPELCAQRYSTATKRLDYMEAECKNFVRVSTFKVVVSIGTLMIVGLFGLSLANYKANVEILAALKYTGIIKLQNESI